MDIYQIFGYIGSFMLAVLYFPQLYDTYNTKNVEGISVKFLIFNILASIAWTIYGIGFIVKEKYIDSIIVILPNVSIMTCIVILLLMIRHFRLTEKI
tara:strand:+ start:3605 stop:3895 length:291 start_codon:yes stop_codon:yes gene_type:complete